MAEAPIVLTRDIKFAEHALSGYMNRFLAGSGFTLPQWFGLSRLIMAGPMAPNLLASQMAPNLQISEAAALATVNELLSSGALEWTDSDETTLDLTSATRARCQPLRMKVDQLHSYIYAGISDEEIATTHRVLALLTERFAAEPGGLVGDESS